MGMKFKNLLILLIILLTFAIVWLVINLINQKSALALSKADQTNIPIIVLDAGHGGIDGGAVAFDGTVEKDINLNIALKLRDYLNFSDISVVMTRETDISIHDEKAASVRDKKVSDLHNRLKIIETTPNAVFVSIHQNKFTVAKYKGTQVFFSPNNEQSMMLASLVQKSVTSQIQPENKREIKRSGDSIYLLNETKRPAILVECGFLSNQEETGLLKKDEYQNQMAFSICVGILDFFRERKTEQLPAGI